MLATPPSSLEVEALTNLGGPREWLKRTLSLLASLRVAVTTTLLIWIFYATGAQMIWMITPVPLPTLPVTLLDPFQSPIATDSSR